MEEQIDISKTRRMSWDAVSRILEDSVHELLRKKILIRAWAEDTDYWGAIAQDYRFSLDDLNRLMDSVQANSTVRLNQNALFHCKSSFDYSGKRKANPRNLGLALDENIQVCCTGSVSCCGRCVIHHFVSSTPF